MTDPAEIDLEKVKGCCSDIPKLIAAVEALREQLERCKDEFIEATHPEFGSSWRGEWERAEAAEAHVAKLAAALKNCIGSLQDLRLELSRHSRRQSSPGWPVIAEALTALAAMPTKEPAP